MMTSETAQAARRPAGAIRSGDLVLSAARIEAEAASKRGDPLNAVHCKRAAELRERVATAPEYMTEIGVGRELVPASILGENSRALEFADTVQNPNYVTVDASRDRLDLAHRAGTLELGLDAAESIEARNSLEKMLAHQLAAMHASSLKLTEPLNRCIAEMMVLDPDVRERANVQGTRLAGAITRLNTSFQQGLLALQRVRSGGQQVVTVQHVQVNEGGQAIVAGMMKAGGGGKRTGGGRGTK